MIRKAKITDVKAIQKLINYYAEKGEMLPRALNELYENLRDFYVSEENGVINGCCALHIAWEDLAEIRSLAIEEKDQRRGLGSSLLKACLEEARELGIPKVFALTYIPKFFEKHNFVRVERSSLPHKIWSDCIKCVKFPDCGEIPLIYKF